MPKLLLHVEGFVVLLCSLFVYQMMDYSWWLFILLLFVPDVSALGYVVNKRVGAVVYNLVHTYVLALILLGVGYMFAIPIVVVLGVILVAHIGMDRMCGFGLKYPSAFQDTHMQRL